MYAYIHLIFCNSKSVLCSEWLLSQLVAVLIITMNHRHNSYARNNILALTESSLLSAAVKELNHQCGVMAGGDW